MSAQPTPGDPFVAIAVLVSMHRDAQRELAEILVDLRNAKAIGPFAVYGKTEEKYSVRHADGSAVCTCAYNPVREERAGMAQMIADALNVYVAAIVKHTKETTS